MRVNASYGNILMVNWSYQFKWRRQLKFNSSGIFYPAATHRQTLGVTTPPRPSPIKGRHLEGSII